ncbi:MAG: AAA family ATPase [Mesorhizobium sp.]
MDDFDLLIARPSPEAKQQEEKRAAVQIFGDKEPISREKARKSERTEGSVIVFSSIGNVGTGEGKRVSKEFEKVLNALLPLSEVPDLAKVRTRLIDEFPYAIAVIDELLKRLAGRGCIHFHPTILVGTPGCGKTRLARRLCEELDVPFELVSCGGMSDSALGGTPRRWSSGEPSIPVMAIRRHHCAGPVIILDEIEKVGTGRRNGNPHDVLIGLFERETSERWFDPYVESPCVLSNVSWLMTANTLTGMPSVLLDRCRVIKVPEPGPEHLDVLAPRILEQIYADAGYDPRWAMPLDRVEIGAIAAAWPGGSIRQLYRLVEKLVELREAMQPRQ